MILRSLSVSLLLTSLLLGVASAQTTPVYIHKRPSQQYAPLSAEVLAQFHATDVEDYGPFAIVQVPAAETSTIAARAEGLGLSARAEPTFAEVRLRDFAVTQRNAAAPDLPADLSLADYSGPVGLYVVQFKALVRPAWLAGLRALGARVIQYLPENSYLVALDPSRRTALTALPTVRHHIVYQPGYKVEASLRAKFAGERAVTLQLDSGQAWESLVAQLESVAAEPVTYGYAGAEVNVHTSLSADKILALARDPLVLWIEPVALAGLSDERACQVVAGNHDGSQATNPGTYLSYINGQCFGCLANLNSYIANVIDTGLDGGMSGPFHPDLGASRVSSWGSYPLNPGEDGEDVTSHGTMVAGLIAGNPQQAGGTLQTDPSGFYYGSGIAPTALLRISDFFTTNGAASMDATKLQNITYDGFIFGSRFQNLSFNLYGSQSSPPVQQYDLLAQMADRLVRDASGLFETYTRPTSMSISAGNLPLPGAPACLRCVVSPANAKNATVVGATTENRTEGVCTSPSNPINHVAALSARKVRGDNLRIKPDFVAPATRAVSTYTQWNETDLWGQRYGGLCPQNSTGTVPGTPTRFGYGAGTSFAAPQATGLSILFAAYHKYLAGVDPSPAMIRAMMAIGHDRMIGGIDDATGAALDQNPIAQGWGRLEMNKLFDGTPSRLGDEDHGVVPTRRFTATGQTFNWTFTVADWSKPVRIAMAFTDRYASTNTKGGLLRVNQVYLYALQGGATYCDGTNYDSSGYSIRSPGGCFYPDRDNNIKFISIAPYSFTGQFDVQVMAGNIAMNAVPGLDGSAPNQDIAVWAWNAY